MTGLQEAFVIAMTTPSLILAYSILFALGLRKLWFSAALSLLWGAWAIHLILDQIRYEPLITAQKIGCIGSSNTYLILGTGICAVMLGVTLIFRRR